MNPTIYLDHAATTPVDPRVFEVMKPYFCEKYGNPSSLHKKGVEAKMAVDDARCAIAEYLNCHAREVIFTGSGTESDNLAILGAAEANRERGNHIITTQIEHHAVLHTCEYLGKNGFDVTYLPVDEYGLVRIEDLKNALTDQTILVSIIYANNEIGTVQPIAEMAELVKGHKGATGHVPLFHTDACQAACSQNIDVEGLGVDLLTLNAGKIYGPKGIGLLYIKKGTLLASQVHGGGHEFKVRAGTENTPSIVGFAKALELVQEHLTENVARLAKLRDRLYTGITDALPDITLNGHPEKRLPNNLNLTVKGVEGEVMLIRLDMENICASAGSACSAGKTDPSHVLTAIGRSKQEAYQSIRLSLGCPTTEEEIETALKAFIKIIQEARQESGTY